MTLHGFSAWVKASGDTLKKGWWCAVDVMMQAALRIRGAQGKWVGAVPEYSAPGESQPNGRAERSVRELEDMLRTLKAALEARIGARIPSWHPIIRWMIEYMATIVNKYKVHDDHEHEITAYEDLHGHAASE